MKIHILLSGRPLCAFTTELPVNWPNAHSWVSLYERDVATCGECKREAKRLSPPPPEEDDAGVPA